jgi:hypothetical protein
VIRQNSISQLKTTRENISSQSRAQLRTCDSGRFVRRMPHISSTAGTSIAFLEVSSRTNILGEQIVQEAIEPVQMLLRVRTLPF